MSMAHVYVEARLRAERSARVRFLVDTGATYGLLPPALARQIGLKAGRMRETVHLANGKTIRVPVALGQLRVDGREVWTKFWIGQCDQPLLGVENLEGLGMAVDPNTGKVKPTRPWAMRLGGLVGR
jgi:clan AA aspartic protease